MPNWMNSEDSGWIWKTKRENRRKRNRFYLVSSNREKECKILNRVMFALRHQTTKYTHLATEKSMLGEEARKDRGGGT